MSDWLVHSSGPWKKHKYKSRSGSPGNYSYVYPKTASEGVVDAYEKKKRDDYNDSAANNAASQRIAAQQAGKKWQAKQNENYFHKNLRTGLKVLDSLNTKNNSIDRVAHKKAAKKARTRTIGARVADYAQNNAASQRIAVQQAGKEWQEKQAKKHKEAARDKELHSGLNAEQKKRGNDAASKARKESEKRKNDSKIYSEAREATKKAMKKAARKEAVTNAVRSLTKIGEYKTRKKYKKSGHSSSSSKKSIKKTYDLTPWYKKHSDGRHHY